MDVLRLYRDFNVPHATDGHKHTRPGWVNTECPYCTGNPGLHLGWHLIDEYFMCWRCGWHPPMLTVSKLLHINLFEVAPILKHYGINKSIIKELPKDKKPFKFPSGVTEELRSIHKKYLRSRNFDPKEIQDVWKIQSAGPVSGLDGISYANRIIIPFFWNGQPVTFDSRTVNPSVENRYKACPIQREYIEHKRILYGNQEAWKSTGICCEGPTDVWRMGEYSFATSGIKFTHKQVRVIANTFKRVAIVFDSDPQAIVQAKKLEAELKARGIEAWRETIKGDPGALKPNEAKELVKRIMKK